MTRCRSGWSCIGHGVTQARYLIHSIRRSSEVFGCGVCVDSNHDAETSNTHSAGIGFAPNGLRAMDLIEPGFRPLYENVSCGNKDPAANHIFFEGRLTAEGCGTYTLASCTFRN